MILKGEEEERIKPSYGVFS